jgi:hypothetical protein
MSKGSWPRPVDHKKFSDNFDAIFGKPKKAKQVKADGGKKK